MNSDNSSTGGIGFFGLLAIVFIVLKLCGVIDWTWWWVLSPLWIPAGVVAGILLAVLVVVCVLHVFERR